MYQLLHFIQNNVLPRLIEVYTKQDKKTWKQQNKKWQQQQPQQQRLNIILFQILIVRLYNYWNWLKLIILSTLGGELDSSNTIYM